MARFDAGTAVEELEYDFSKYDAGTGVVPEPSQGRLNQYRRMIKELAIKVREFRKDTVDLPDNADDLSEEEAMETLDSLEEMEAHAEGFQLGTVQAFAVLCGADFEEDGVTLVGGTPSFEDLSKLPFRVMQAFGQWIMGELSPKSTQPTPIRPQPQGFKRSRKAVKRSSS